MEELTTTGLDRITAFPYHGADGTTQHVWFNIELVQLSETTPISVCSMYVQILTGDKTLEEWLFR